MTFMVQGEGIAIGRLMVSGLIVVFPPLSQAQRAIFAVQTLTSRRLQVRSAYVPHFTVDELVAPPVRGRYVHTCVLVHVRCLLTCENHSPVRMHVYSYIAATRRIFFSPFLTPGVFFDRNANILLPSSCGLRRSLGARTRVHAHGTTAENIDKTDTHSRATKTGP